MKSTQPTLGQESAAWAIVIIAGLGLAFAGELLAWVNDYGFSFWGAVQ